jgi:hypothetical protein
MLLACGTGMLIISDVDGSSFSCVASGRRSMCKVIVLALGIPGCLFDSTAIGGFTSFVQVASSIALLLWRWTGANTP